MMQWIRKHPLLILFIAGIAVRLVCSIYAYNGDVNTHITWSRYLVDKGFSGFYEPHPHIPGFNPNYPPLILFAFTIVYRLYSSVGPIIWFLNIHVPIFPSGLVYWWQNQSFMLPAFMKIPAMCADLGFAYIAFAFARRLIKKRNSGIPYVAAACVLFNPAFFYNSSYWGQIEAVPILFGMWSFYELLYSKNYVFSLILMALAFLGKQTAVVFLPLYFLVLIRHSNLKQICIGFVFSLLIFFVSFIPFYKNGNFIFFPFVTYWSRILTSFGSDFLTAHAFNIWGLATGLGHIRDSSVVFLHISARIWSEMFVVVLIFYVLYTLYRRGFKTGDIIAAGYLIPMSFFFFMTRMHERHLEMALPFLLLASLHDKKTFSLFLYLSFFHFLNLYSGWWSPHSDVLITIFSPAWVTNVMIIIALACFFSLLFRFGYDTIKQQYAPIS